MWRHGHRMLAPYPCAFGHETAGVRADTGERVLVSDSVACGACAPCRAGRAQICRDPRGCSAASPNRSRRPRRRSTRSPTASRRTRRRWPSRSPPPSTRSTAAATATDVGVARRRADGPDAGRAAGRRGPIGDPRRSAPRAPRAGRRAGRHAAERLDQARARLRGRRPARGLARRGRGRRARAPSSYSSAGVRAGSEVTLPTGAAPLRGARAARDLPPLRRPTSTARWPRSPTAEVPWPALLRDRRSRSNDLPAALATPNGGPALKWVVDPRR